MATKSTAKSQTGNAGAEDLTITVPREKAVGAATGAVVGSIVAGPLGAVVGGAIGTIMSGKRKDLKEAAAAEVKAVKQKATAIANAGGDAKKGLKKTTSADDRPSHGAKRAEAGATKKAAKKKVAVKGKRKK